MKNRGMSFEQSGRPIYMTFYVIHVGAIYPRITDGPDGQHANFALLKHVSRHLLGLSIWTSLPARSLHTCRLTPALRPHFIQPNLHKPTLLPTHPLTLYLPSGDTPRHLIRLVRHPVIPLGYRMMVYGLFLDRTEVTVGFRDQAISLRMSWWICISFVSMIDLPSLTKHEERKRQNVHSMARSPS